MSKENHTEEEIMELFTSPTMLFLNGFLQDWCLNHLQLVFIDLLDIPPHCFFLRWSIQNPPADAVKDACKVNSQTVLHLLSLPTALLVIRSFCILHYKSHTEEESITRASYLPATPCSSSMISCRVR